MSKRRRPLHTGHDSPEGAEEEQHARGERLQKVLAAAGIASRRECEELIATGRVEVDKKIVTELGTRVDPVRSEIRVDGVSLHRPKLVHYLLNKPVGVVCTNYDPSGRVRVIDLINTDERIFPVGRLDRSSEGLILVTNDGTLANRLTHPRYGVEKTYLASVEGHPTPPTLEKLRDGIHLAEGMARVADIRFKRRHPTTSELIIVLREGRNREIRRILARVGHKVLRLKRIAIGPIKIEDLATGAYRKLTYPEVQELEKSVTKARKAAKRKDSGKAGRPRTATKSAASSARPSTRPPRPTSQKPPRVLPTKRSFEDDDFDGDDDDFIPISEADFASDFSTDDTSYDTPEYEGKVLGMDDEGDRGQATSRSKKPPRRFERSPQTLPGDAGPPTGKKPFGRKPFGQKTAGQKTFGKKRGGNGGFAGAADRAPAPFGERREKRKSDRPFGGKKGGKFKKRGRR